MARKEMSHSIHQLSHLAAAVFGDEEAVLAFRLEALQLAAPPAGPDGVAVRPPPGRPRVRRRNGDQQRDVNGTDIFRPYSNSIRSERVFIHPYSIPSIQYP